MWRETFGFGFGSLTRSEARYLENSPDAQTIRDRLTASARQPSGHYRAAAIQEPSKEVGWFRNHRQGCPQVVRMIGELARRTCKKVERLFWAQAPVFPETIAQVFRGE